MKHLEGSGTPVLYVGRTVLKGSKVVSHTQQPRLLPQEIFLVLISVRG